MSSAAVSSSTLSSSPFPPARRLFHGRAKDPALVAGGETVTYAELTRRVETRGEQLGATRRLVMITAGNAVEPIVTYLAAVEGGHPVLFVPDGAAHAGHRNALIARFDPDVVAGGRDDGWELTVRHTASSHRFHPDLAMLASTSGSTGSPKLVRLSFENLRSNAVAIADYLGLEPHDRAATTLPLQYCYGLSVVNSHLGSGASLLLTERSVAEEEFWTDMVRGRATSFAGVPYTFELLEAAGFEHRDLPDLRAITQAGGRLAPDLVRRYAALGAARGFELFVMYGQTEATARMAYLPPRLAGTAAGAIGQAIPGGTLRVDEAGVRGGGNVRGVRGVGELVYSGPNVMMGYAHEPADFALGRTVRELRTGDLARQRDDGLFEVVGRMNRFAKVYGLRVDLDELERQLRDAGFPARVVTVDERLLVFVPSERLVADAVGAAAAVLDIPPHAVEGFAIAEFPRTASGKPDTAALIRFADEVRAAQSVPDEDASADGIRALYARLLGRPDATADDSFAALGGDSLSYVEVSVRLEDLLGTLPRDWPELSPRQLSAQARPERGDAPDAASRPPRRGGRSRFARLDTSVALRAIAIVLIVGSHADLFVAQGGAHLLLAAFGFNLARFQLSGRPGHRSAGLLRSVAQFAIPAVVWIGVVAMISGSYRLTTVFLLNGFLPNDGRWHPQWDFWFLELAVWSMLGVAALCAVRRVDRLERAHPFGFALALLGVALAIRFAVTGVEAGLVERYTLPAALWLIALGWAGARATRWEQRLMLSVVTIGATFGFLGNPAREAVIAAGILVLLWLPAVILPRTLVPAVTALAGASMFIYLTHWQVFPAWERTVPLVGTLLSLLVGIVVWRAYRVIERTVVRRAAIARRGNPLAPRTGRPHPTPRRRPERPAGSPAHRGRVRAG
jgi:acyl-coenzyme A synthetase/AMP-(fatty) acid ligase